MQDSATAAEAAPQPPLPTSIALGITLGAVVLIVGFLVLGTALKLQPLYAGFLLLWFWTTVDGSRFSALPATMIGAFGGLGNSYLLQWGTHTNSGPVLIAALVLMVVALFMVIARRLPIVFNASYMLFLTVLNAPLIQQGEAFDQVLAATALGIVWFGASIWLVQLIVARRQPQTLTPAVGQAA